MKKYFEEPLFIFEMANNHMGSLEHGRRMIREYLKHLTCMKDWRSFIRSYRRK